MLHEWLRRFNESEAGKATFEDQAEQRALWNLECVIEAILVEPFDKNYPDLVEKARARLRDRVEIA